MHELVLGSKPFASDFDVRQYALNKEPILIPSILPNMTSNRRFPCVLRSVIAASLSIDWWARPTCLALRRLLSQSKFRDEQFSPCKSMPAFATAEWETTPLQYSSEASFTLACFYPLWDRVTWQSIW